MNCVSRIGAFAIVFCGVGAIALTQSGMLNGGLLAIAIAHGFAVLARALEAKKGGIASTALNVQMRHSITNLNRPLLVFSSKTLSEYLILLRAALGVLFCWLDKYFEA
ncbi:MAG: hypothetical protein ACK41E_11720 [Deinococcales bacterium]